MSKRVLVSAYFAGNLGDDLFLRILFDRYPHVKWDLMTANRNYNNTFKSYKNVKIIYSYREINIGKKAINLFFKINEIFLNYKKYDAFLNIGGSIFMQSPAWKIKFNEREYLVNTFNNLNKKAFVLGANFGPYKEEVFIEKYRELFTGYDDICFRDNYSYHKFLDLENVRVAPDVVFTLATNDYGRKEKCVGISIIDIEGREELKKFYNEYNEKIARLAERYIDQGYQIKLFSFCENEGDLNVIQMVREKIKSSYQQYVDIFNYQGKLEPFLEEFKSCEIIVGTRFHSIILAIINEQKFYPIIYNEKTLNMLDDLQKAEFHTHIKDIAQMDIVSVMESVREHYMEKENPTNNANKQFEKLDLFLA